MGGWPILLGPEESRLGGREPIPDMAGNLSQWADCLVARVHRHRDIEELSVHATIPVVNALSDLEHPCQAVADLLTLQDEWGTFAGRRLVYVGDWNNVSRSLSRACALTGLTFHAICPNGYGPDSREAVDCSTNLENIAGADAVYTDVWTSMGQEKEFDTRKKLFASYQVNEDLMVRAGKSALFLHCLPAHRGLEVSAGVIDSDRSLVLKQAANRLPAEMAVLESLMEVHYEKPCQESRARVFRRSRHLDHHSVAQ
jgi:ornithine carbamoyltransferase